MMNGFILLTVDLVSRDKINFDDREIYAPIKTEQYGMIYKKNPKFNHFGNKEVSALSLRLNDNIERTEIIKDQDDKN